MSWVERRVEQRIAEAMERGELDAGPLHGQPITDLDRPRQEGWWAERFVARERRRLAREEAAQIAERWRQRFGVVRDGADLRQRVEAANAWVDDVNGSLHPDDRLRPFDLAEVERDWRRRD